MSKRFIGLTRELCDKAFNVIQPAVQDAMLKGVVKRPHGYLVVCSPKFNVVHAKTRDLRFKDQVVLAAYSFGETSAWEHPFDEIALAKAEASWETGLPSYQIQHAAPYLFRHRMAKYGGSAVGKGGLVVAFSGVEEWYDQMISEWMLATIKAVCLHEVYKPGGLMDDDEIALVGVLKG